LRELLVRRFRHSAAWCQWASLRRLRLRTAPGFRAGCATSVIRSHMMCKPPACAGLRLVRPVLIRCACKTAAPCCLAAVRLAPRQGCRNYGRRWGFKSPRRIMMGRGRMRLGPGSLPPPPPGPAEAPRLPQKPRPDGGSGPTRTRVGGSEPHIRSEGPGPVPVAVPLDEPCRNLKPRRRGPHRARLRDSES
jgi:hypothetical protein